MDEEKRVKLSPVQLTNGKQVHSLREAGKYQFQDFISVPVMHGIDGRCVGKTHSSGPNVLTAINRGSAVIVWVLGDGGGRWPGLEGKVV